MADYTKEILDLLSANGCYFLRRGKGSHKMWYSPITNRPFTVVTKNALYLKTPSRLKFRISALINAALAPGRFRYFSINSAKK